MGVNFELDSDVVDGAASDALARMPQAQEGFQGPNDEGAGDPAATLPTNTPQPGDGEKDSLGMAWNPAEHATGKDGKGVKTADGAWRKKRRSKVGGTPKTATADGAAPATDAAGKVILTDAQKAQAMQCGVVMAECIFQSAQAFGGAEWEPRVKPVDERANMQGAFGAYFIAKGVTDMPPSLILLVALGGYMIPRFTNHAEFPDTRTRMQKVREWIGVRVDRFKQRRAAAKNQAPATKEIGKETGDANAKL